MQADNELPDEFFEQRCLSEPAPLNGEDESIEETLSDDMEMDVILTSRVTEIPVLSLQERRRNNARFHRHWRGMLANLFKSGLLYVKVNSDEFSSIGSNPHQLEMKLKCLQDHYGVVLLHK